MNPKTRYFTIFVMAIVAVTVFVCRNYAFCHGSGGGGGGGGDNDSASNLATYEGSATTFVSELTPEELATLTSGLSCESKEALLHDMNTWPEAITVKDLLIVIDSGTPVSALTEADIKELFANLNANVQLYLSQDFSVWTADLSVLELKNTISRWQERDRSQANLEAYLTDKAATSVEILDWVGEKTQTVLSFCPGIGLTTSVMLDAVREGANSRKEGKKGSEILQDIAVKATTSFATNYYSKADGLWDEAMNGKNVESILPALTAYGLTKQAEGEIGSAMEKATKVDEKDIEKLDIATAFFSDLVYGMPQKSKNKAAQPAQSQAFGPTEGPALHTAQ